MASKLGETPPLVIDLHAAGGYNDDDESHEDCDQQNLPPGDALSGPGAYVIHVVFFMGRGLGTVR